MKQNDDGKTVRAMDVLFPKIGEIIGGSQREEDFNKLQTRAKEMGVPQKDILVVSGYPSIRNSAPFGLWYWVLNGCFCSLLE